ncbi:hypothetical protein GTO91_14865 [Heliobacterium undosum]|uniref:Uncharacterized protein n=1 Tax=Heliomicrobium undosum TaxID=121734 RepID=A0A845L310_9FIRM|nr:hypothetical protein [Heliomicrobium undosum]MZP30997.1 hypothetical protein [Heliomicrobium undosum]
MNRAVDLIAELCNLVIFSMEHDISPYGQRCVLVPIRAMEMRREKSADVSAEWAIHAGGKERERATFTVRDVPLKVASGRSLLELFRALFQVALSGAKATIMDHQAFFDAAGPEWSDRYCKPR